MSKGICQTLMLGGDAQRDNGSPVRGCPQRRLTGRGGEGKGGSAALPDLLGGPEGSREDIRLSSPRTIVRSYDVVHR